MPAYRLVVRFVVASVTKMAPRMREAYASSEVAADGQFLLLFKPHFSDALAAEGLAGDPDYQPALDSLEIRKLPSLRWKLVVNGKPKPQAAVNQLLIPYQFLFPEGTTADAGILAAFIAAFEARLQNDPELGFDSAASDLAFALDEHWCPGGGAGPLFGTRNDADRLIGLDGIGPRPARAAVGAGVNIVLVDERISPGVIAEGLDGWLLDGALPVTDVGGHIAMMVRNIRDVAPAARIFLVPLIPPRILNLDAFLSDAIAAYIQIYVDIESGTELPPGRWIFVNAWNVYDRRIETSPGEYTGNPEHPFNGLVRAGTDVLQFDFAFSAGNCGQFCPDSRCGPGDIGPGNSILGANSLAHVVTVGAARADGVWLGYSSQGPGQTGLGAQKPDLCAPSQFCEANDATLLSVGTSAACGLAAGAMAALRGAPAPFAGPPDALRQLLRNSARPVSGTAADPGRFGSGILNLAAAWAKAGKPPL